MIQKLEDGDYYTISTREDDEYFYLTIYHINIKNGILNYYFRENPFRKVKL